MSQSTPRKSVFCLWPVAIVFRLPLDRITLCCFGALIGAFPSALAMQKTHKNRSRPLFKQWIEGILSLLRAKPAIGNALVPSHSPVARDFLSPNHLSYEPFFRDLRRCHVEKFGVLPSPAIYSAIINHLHPGLMTEARLLRDSRKQKIVHQQLRESAKEKLRPLLAASEEMLNAASSPEDFYGKLQEALSKFPR